MMRTDRERQEQLDEASDRLLWQRCRVANAPEDESARFLDFAAFADELLEEEERERVAAMLAADPKAAADVEAARALAGAPHMMAGLQHIVARACAILPDSAPARGRVVAFAPRRARRHVLHNFAQWGGIAAALLLASWLGFAMGTDASLSLSEPRQPSEAGFLSESFDPAISFLRDLGEGLRT